MSDSSEELNQWLIDLNQQLSIEEYIRLNYNSIIESIIERLVAIDVQKSQYLLNSLLEPLLKTLSYNRRHPSPQRSICFLKSIDILTAMLEIRSEQLTATAFDNQNVLIKIIKLMLKDNSSEDLNNELVIKITDRLLKFLETIRVLPKLEPNSNLVIVLNNLILNSIRCLYLLINNFNIDIKTRDSNQFCGQILGILKICSLHGIPNYDISQIRSSGLFPSPFIQFNELTEKGLNDEKSGSVNKKNRHKKNKNKNKLHNEDLEDDDDDCIALNTDRSNVKVMTSDSEFSSSDYETTQNIDDLRVQKSISIKIRHISYECLFCAISLFEKKVIFGFWSSFIQDLTPGSLIWAISKEPSNRVKSSALNFLHSILMTGNPYVMTLADDSSVKPTKYTSFTPLSLSLAQMVAEIHNGMNSILFAENNISVLIQTFKCLSLLVTISPYRKLKSGLLYKLFDNSISLLTHKEIQIQNSCLALAVKIFELEPFPEEMKTFMQTERGIIVVNRLFDHSFDSIIFKKSILLCGESLKLLTTVLKQKVIVECLLNCKEIHLSLDQLMNISVECLENETFASNLVIQSLVCKYLFSLGTTLKNKIRADSIQIQRNWWLSVLNSKLIVSGLNRTDQTIPQSTQCVIIDFISTISSEIFESFETKLKFHLISILIAILKNNDSIVEDLSCQSAAIRCLGVYQSFKSMTEDLDYLFDVSMLAIEILDNFSDYYPKKSSHLLLNQSSWTLANFCDILKKSYLDNTSEVKVDFLFRLIQTILNNFDIQSNNSMQNENIKTNFVRCLGSALYLILIREQKHPTIDFNTKSNDYLKMFFNLNEKFIKTLKNSKSFKLQWNICIAFSYLLENQLFLDLCQSDTDLSEIDTSSGISFQNQLIDQIFSTLLNLMQNSRNHKVQSYAVFAICSPTTYKFNEQKFKDLWILITNFLIDNYQSVPNNIKDNWFEKFCISINKMIVNYFTDNIKTDPKVNQTISDLLNFLNNQTVFAEKDQNNCDFVITLIENLNKNYY